eukprot:3036760-Pyramimonas_sp.AAC.1
MLLEVSTPAELDEQQDEIDAMVDQMLQDVSEPAKHFGEQKGEMGEATAEEKPQHESELEHLLAIQQLNGAMDQMESEGDALCLLRGVDGKGELLPLSTPTTKDCKPRILPGGRSRLLLYSALATGSVWNGQKIEDAPIMGDSQEERRQWALLHQALSPRQRIRLRRGASRITVSVRAMLDSWASQDFVSQHLVNEKQLRIQAAPMPLEVTVADGTCLTANRVVHLSLTFQGYTYMRPLYVLPLGVSATVILGAPFPSDINPFLCDMRQEARTITFRKHGKTVRLVPTPKPLPGMLVISLRRAMLDMRVRRRLLNSAGEEAALAYLCVLLPTEPEEEAKAVEPATVAAAEEVILDNDRPGSDPNHSPRREYRRSKRPGERWTNSSKD